MPVIISDDDRGVLVSEYENRMVNLTVRHPVTAEWQSLQIDLPRMRSLVLALYESLIGSDVNGGNQVVALKQIDKSLTKPRSERGNYGEYEEVIEAVVGAIDTDKGIVITEVEQEELDKRLIPNVRRAIARRLNRRLVVAVADGVDGVVFYVGAPIVSKPKPEAASAEAAKASKPAA